MNIFQSINLNNRSSRSRAQRGRSAGFINLLVLFFCVGLTATAQAQDNWRLYLDTVRVEQAREGGGDRPYFNTIIFRSRLMTPGSTQVELRSREPNDWVSKSEYNFGGLRGGNHMLAGDQLAIPWWMGQHEFRDVRIVKTSDPDVLHAEIFGAMIVSLDNNNTPPHLVRGQLQKVVDQVTQVLREQVETGAILGCFISPNCFTDTLGGIGLRNDLFELLGLAIGSTFNPDQLTGVQILLFPTLDGYNFNLPPIVKNGYGGPFTIGVPVLRTPTNLSGTLRFEGSGARYSVNYRFLRDTDKAETPATALTWYIRTGEDDLRAGSQAQAYATLCDGREITLALNNGAEWGKRSNNYRTLFLPAGTRLGDLRTIGLRFAPGSSGAFDTGDNWDVDAVKVLYSTPTGSGYYNYWPLLIQQGNPLQRFTGSVRNWNFDVAQGEFNRTSTLSGLRVTLRTGGDDLRTNSQAVAILNLMDGRRLRYALNRGANLGNNTTNTFTLPFYEQLGDIASISVEFTSGSTGAWFETGDNWNMDSIQVVALNKCAAKTVLDKRGAPLFRFTGEARFWSSDINY